MNSTKDAITGTPSRTQEWDFDAMGNWLSLTNDGGTPEERQHNLQNEITEIGSNALAYDENGNLTQGDDGKVYFYDAWNRLVEVQDDEENSLAQYAYDALRRRITETHASEVKDLYYSEAWQVLEVRIEDEAAIQYVWSPVYVDALLLRDRDTDDNGSLDERLYVQQDANWNVTALVDVNGDVVERYAYDSFGTSLIYDDSWTTRSSSDFAWQHLHQGLRYDVAVSLLDGRMRVYDPEKGRWLQQDPIGFSAGDTNVYRMETNNPIRYVDPSGLQGIGYQPGEPGYQSAGRPRPLPPLWWERPRPVDSITPIGPFGSQAEFDRQRDIHYHQFWGEFPPQPGGWTLAWGPNGWAYDAIPILSGGRGLYRLWRRRPGDCPTRGSILLSRPQPAPVPQGSNAAARLPNLQGMTRADAHIAIRNQGFQYRT